MRYNSGVSELLFLNAFLIGAGVLLLLFIRALPRMDESAPARQGLVERWLTSQLPERIDAAARGASLRFLRRARVLVMRIDNGINEKLRRMKLESGEPVGGGRIDLKKVAETKAPEEDGVLELK